MVIEKDGLVDYVSIVCSIIFELDVEVVWVVKFMLKWKLVIVKDKVVCCRYIVFVIFKL